MPSRSLWGEGGGGGGGSMVFIKRMHIIYTMLYRLASYPGSPHVHAIIDDLCTCTKVINYNV